MTRWKKRLLLAAGIAVLAAGAASFLKSQNKVIYGVSQGTYAAVGADALRSPSVTFDLKNHRFFLTHNPLSSYAAAGIIEISAGEISAFTDDGKCAYIFEVVDNDTICFVQKGSVQRLGETAIADGAEFKYVTER